MNNNNFFKKYNSYEVTKYEFEHDMSIDRPYITEVYTFDKKDDVSNYLLYCPHCKERVPVVQCHFMDQKIHCICGASYTADELKAHMHDYMSYSSWSTHNVINGTYNKVSVSTLLGNILYCNECHKTHYFRDLPVENKQRICTCGKRHSFDDLKVSTSNTTTNFTSGNVYFDEHKITISFLEYFTDINGNGQYYWQPGGQRLTMNLETGFSYLYNDGYRYREFNQIYRKEHGTNAPKMFNCTYANYSSTLELVATAKFDSLIVKYADKPNLVKLMTKNRRAYFIIFNKMLKQIDDYMTNYYNNKYSYKIKSLMELSNDDFKSYDSWMLPLRNRFINLNKNQLERARYVLQNIKQLENKRNYKRLSRETNDIAYEYVCTTTKVSKKLKKEIYAKIQKSYSLPSHIDEFVAFTRFFKNKENINKVYYTMCGERKYSHHTYKMTDNVMKLWMSYRNEQYLSNLNKQDLFEKLNYMYDSEMLINRIRKVYGTDWDLNSIKFYNEQQLHDNLVRITNSEDFLRLYNAEAYEREIKPFEMEDDVFELEKDTEIQIARNRATLTNIGQAMGICVGGYGGQVECGYCRIAYLKVNDAYEVCIELKKHKNPDTKKFEYTIVQAKLKYNELVGKKEFYYNIVKEWADKHNIAIDTYDMKVYDENKIAIEY